MDIEREKELYSRIEGLRSDMEGLYDKVATKNARIEELEAALSSIKAIAISFT